MPRGIPGSGPNAGRGKGRKTGKSHTLADIAARSGGGQQASNGQQATGSAAPAAAPAPAPASTGRGRGGRGRKTATGAKTTARRGTGTRGQRAGNGQQRADQTMPPANGGKMDINGVEIEVMAVPGRGGRPQQSEAYPFAALEVSQKNGEEIVGPSFLIPEDKNPDNVLAAARKRHKGKTFTARKMEGGVRIWRLT
jgi:hypothetical protein